MKNRPSRWLLLILPVALLFVLSCARDATTAAEVDPSRAVAQVATSEATAQSAQTLAKPKQCPRESPEFYIYVDLTQTDKVRKVTPFHAEVCPEQEVFWISRTGVPVKPVWKEMLVPPGDPTPDHIVPCAAPSDRCGGAKFDLPAGRKIRYDIQVFRNGPDKPATETIDPQLEVLP